MMLRSFRLPNEEVQLWRAAAMVMGISQTELVRRAIKEKAGRVLASGEYQQISGVGSATG